MEVELVPRLLSSFPHCIRHSLSTAGRGSLSLRRKLLVTYSAVLAPTRAKQFARYPTLTKNVVTLIGDGFSVAVGVGLGVSSLGSLFTLVPRAPIHQVAPARARRFRSSFHSERTAPPFSSHSTRQQAI